MIDGNDRRTTIVERTKPEYVRQRCRNGCLEVTGLLRTTTIAVLAVMGVVTAGCTPTVKVAADEPITINLNVNIKHEILVKVDKELDDLFDEDSDLF